MYVYVCVVCALCWWVLGVDFGVIECMQYVEGVTFVFWPGGCGSVMWCVKWFGSIALEQN